MSQVFSLPIEIQEIIAIPYYNDLKFEVWMLKFNGSKVTIEIEAKEMCMELKSEMSLIHLFHVHWLYQRPKFLLNYVDHVNIRHWGWIILLTDVVDDLVIEYNTFIIMNHDIIYDYISLFSKTCCVDNVINTKLIFERMLQQLDLQKKIK